MAIVYGQIESLKRIKETLKANGIDRFHSVSDILDFKKNSLQERNAILLKAEKALMDEIHGLKIEIERLNKDIPELETKKSAELDGQISTLRSQLRVLNTSHHKNLFAGIRNWILTIKYQWQLNSIQENYSGIIEMHTTRLRQNLTATSRKLENYLENREFIVQDRCRSEIERLSHTVEVVEGLYTLVAGAIGENKVSKKLSELPDSYHVIHDFSVQFNPPLYNPKEKDRIGSIQIDHLLISPAGIFIIETKNWSKESIENLNLRSPVEQIRRTSYALFRMVNGSRTTGATPNINHHWGSKKIPIRNILTMTGHKPPGDFMHVKVLSLDQILGYIQYFEPVFSDREVGRIAEALLKQSRN